MPLLATLVFLAVAAGVGGLCLLLLPTQMDQRLDALAHPDRKPGRVLKLVHVLGPLAQLSAPDGEWADSPLRLRFFRAGIRRDDARLIYFGAKTALPLAFALMTFLALRGSMLEPISLMLVMLIAALAGCYLPNLVLHFMLNARRRDIFENFPDAADLMLVCVEAGLGLDAALTKIADEIRIKSAALADELHLTNLELRAGGTREKSLRNLALRTGIEEIGVFATMLTQSDKFGTSIGESLRVFSEDLRNKRQARAEEMAAKIPTKMLIPLVLFIFPSIIMVILGPAAIVIIRTILPMIGGA